MRPSIKGLFVFVGLFLSCGAPVATASQNSAPVITSAPDLIATVEREYQYVVTAEDTDGDSLAITLAAAPSTAVWDSTASTLSWTPLEADLGTVQFVVQASDGVNDPVEQAFDVRVLTAFCPIYPIALPSNVIDGLTPGTVVDHMPRGTGAGNYSWLTWSGAVNTPTLAQSLLPPGDSYNYVNPDSASDSLLEIGDWAQGATGSKNARQVRDNLDALLNTDIILPVWDATRGQGSHFDYQVSQFATVRLTDYSLNGHGWISFEFRGYANCYNEPPLAFNQSVETNEDVPVAIELGGSDADGDALTFQVVDAPTHGILSGAGANLTYTPNQDYFGSDAFTFRSNDGRDESNLATVSITIYEVNGPPEIISAPVTVVAESALYEYAVEAIDPDAQPLHYGLDRTPAGLSIDADSGVISGTADPAFAQPVRAFNSQCYVIPEGAESTDGGFVAPLFQRVRNAINRASTYVAPQTLAWDQRNQCLGCHVQTQALLGLQGSKDRADVDEAAAEYLLSKILSSQQADGSIRRSHPQFARTQTAFALWALSYVPDRERTLDVRERGLRFFLAQRRDSGIQTHWTQDHNSGWLSSPTAETALVALAAGRYIRDIERLPEATAEQIQLAIDLHGVLPRVAEFILAQSSSSNDNLLLALSAVALSELNPHLAAGELKNRVTARASELDATLRAREIATGGWHRTNSGNADALTSAWVGFALDYADPPLTDPVILRNIEFLLASQNADGTWSTNSGLFATYLATTGLVMAYLPVALEHLGNPDLTLGHMRVEPGQTENILSVEVINRGLADIASTSTVTVYAGWPAGSSIEIGQISVDPIHSGETRWVSLSVPVSTALDDVRATIAADTNIDECVNDNNFTQAALNVVRATDPRGLFDTQAFLLNVEDANAAPVITSSPVTEFEQGKPYLYQVTVTDPDVGDAHEYELTTAPSGLYINPLDGRLNYALSELAVGSHAVTVRVTDLRGAYAEQSFQLTVHPNHPPEITSTPGLEATIGLAYRYDVEATDADADALSYRLDGAPLTMSIDAATGVITWTPEPRHLGDQPVAVVAEDGRGGSDRQAFTIHVAPVQVIRGPTITTTAPASVEEGATYRYDIDATDPDNDTLVYAAMQAPAGVDVASGSGELSWFPDQAPPRSDLIESIRQPNNMCRRPAEAGVFDPEVVWTWGGPQGATEYSHVFGPVLVGQFTDDNQDGQVDITDAPDIVAMSGSSQRYLNLIDGRTGVNHWSVRLDTIAYLGTPAIGDLEGDGGMEIVAEFGQRAEELRAFDADGQELWRTAVPSRSVASGGSRDAIALADLEGDGDVEIVRGKMIVEHNGQVRCSGAFDRGGTSNYGLVPTIADIDLDGIQEVIAGRSIYRPDCSRKTQLPASGDGYTAIGNFDEDPEAEIVLVSNGTSHATGRLYLFDHDGTIKFGPISFPGGGALGPPTLANVDADDFPEIGIAGRANYAVFDHTGTLLWQHTVQDASSNQTGSTSFDFEADGHAEIVYSDELNLRVFDGATGAVRMILPNTSGTTLEYPVVVDADADGSADILLGANGSRRGIRMIGSVTRSWAPTRSIWNQHAYHIDNINDDGSIPRHPAKSWLTHNTFRLNTFPDRHPLGLADLALFDLRLDASGTAIHVLVTNRGLAPTSAATSVSIFNGATLLGTLAVPVLGVGEELTLSLEGLDASLVSTNLYARIDEAGAIVECLEDNNATAAAYFDVRATDPDGLFDNQRFTVTVTNVNEAPSILSTALPSAASAQNYRFEVQAQDPDLGDGLRFDLTTAPAGLSIEQVSGELRWTPSAAQAGTHTVVVRVTDLAGLSAERSFELLVADNAPPEITSTPATSATVGTEYQYDVEATDPEGEALSYALTVAPDGMQIDANTGLVTWTPPTDTAAQHAVEVRVSDSRGAFALQSFTLNVSPGANQVPTIISNPPTNALATTLYEYAAQASDADGDPLIYTFTQAPAGMTVDAASGSVNWTPTADQLGTHDVTLQVDDGRGGIATQTWSILVTAAGGGNHAPTITSTPPPQAKVGVAYHYPLVATDADGDTLTYSLSEGPADMQVGAATGALSWTPSATGVFPVRVRVADAQAWVEQGWNLTVIAADVPLAATLTVSPDPVLPGADVTITLIVNGAAGELDVTATLDGTPIQLPPQGSITLPAPTTPGTHVISVEVTDGNETVAQTQEFLVQDPGASDVPVVHIVAPTEAEGQEILVITSPTDVIGQVLDDNLVNWTLVLRERDGTGITPLAEGTNTADGIKLGSIDPTLLLNGQYLLILQGIDANGQTASDSRALIVEGDAKLGHFSITFEDLSIPVAGLPVTVTRTYDTRRRGRALDFGYGWSVGYQNVRIQESRTPGFGWQLMSYPSGPLGTIPNWCVESALGNVVSITLADGEVEKFLVKAKSPCNQGVPIIDIELAFEPMEDTHSKLVALNNAFGRLINGSIADPGDPGTPLNPSRYLLTTEDGRELTLDQGFTVREVLEREGGNTITFSDDGIIHSAGLSVVFVRDAQDRITEVQAPDGSVLHYEYDAQGNLSAFVDALGARTTYTYLAQQGGHYLEEIVDPRGVRVARNEYDENGRLIAVIDADGHRIEYDHDLAGRVETIRDRRGITTVYVYNERGDVLAETNGAGETTLRVYDSNGNTLSETNAAGETRAWTYDALGNVVAATNAAGETTTSAYGPFNQLITQTDALGHVLIDNYFRNYEILGVPIYPGPLTGITDANGHTTAFGYDLSGQLDTLTDATGAVTRMIHDSNGFLTARIEPDGSRTDYVNDIMGRVLSETRTRTNAAGVTETLRTEYTLDGKGRVTSTRHPDGSVTRTEYNLIDKPVSECDALSRCATMQYDNLGRLVRTVYPDGSAESSVYDANGNVITRTDRGGRSTRMVYDAANRLIETIQPDAGADDGDDSNNPRTQNSYDLAGRLIAATDENGNVTRYEYDAAGRRTATVQSAVAGVEARIETIYDAAGRRIASIDPEGHRTDYAYDAGGQLTATVYDDGSGTQVEYDAAGRKTAEIDAMGRRTEYAYDATGRLIGVRLAAGTPAQTNTSYAYDEVGNKISQTDAEGRVTRFEYDRMGRLIARILPAGERESKQYNAAGELIAATDFAGQITSYVHDNAGRVTLIDYPIDADVSFTYNAAGERTAVTDARGTSTVQYDNHGRLLQSIDADGGMIEYQYDAVGNLLARISPSQSLIYAYDARNRLTTVTRSIDGEMPSTTRYQYDQDGNRTVMTGADGTRSEYAYDTRHRLTSLIKRTAASALLLGMSYSVDASGLRTSVQETDASGIVRTVDYQYDALKRLTSEAIDHRDNAKDRASQWTYDTVGNRLSQTLSVGGTSEVTNYTYSANDHLLTETGSGGTTAYTYNANGNTTSKTGPTGTTTYHYNDANRLIEASTASTTTTYVYNADGLRARQTNIPSAGTPTTTWYVQDKAYPYAQVIEAYQSQASGPQQLAATYTFADDLVSQTRYETGVPVTHFVQADGFGSTRWLTDETGAITDAIAFDAFGNQIARTGSTEIEHRYRGERFDANVGMYDLRARLYNPSNGRFLTQDSFAGFSMDPRSLHKYLYAHADPVNNVDPSGHMSMMSVSFGVSVGAILGLGAQTGVAGLFNSYVSADGRPTHYYETEQIRICSAAVLRCTPENVYQAMLRLPAPAHFNPDIGGPVEDGASGYAGWLIFPGGPVTFSRYDSELKLVNETQWWHVLHNGKITRWAQSGMGGVTVKTVGEGDNHTAFIAWANELVGKQAFESLDRSLKAWFASGQSL